MSSGHRLQTWSEPSRSAYGVGILDIKRAWKWSQQPMWWSSSSSPDLVFLVMGDIDEGGHAPFMAVRDTILSASTRLRLPWRRTATIIFPIAPLSRHTLLRDHFFSLDSVFGKCSRILAISIL